MFSSWTPRVNSQVGISARLSFSLEKASAITGDKTPPNQSLREFPLFLAPTCGTSPRLSKDSSAHKQPSRSAMMPVCKLPWSRFSQHPRPAQPWSSAESNASKSIEAPQPARSPYFARVHFQVQTRRSSALLKSGRGIVPHAPFFSRKAASAHGVVGTRRRANKAFQPWVKPEVAPPKWRGSALRNSGRGIVPHAPFFSRKAASAHGVVGTRRRANKAFQPWVKPEVDPPK